MTAEITINGKKYQTEVISGKRYIDGKTVDEFLESLDGFSIADLALIGKQALVDEKRGTKPRKYQKIAKDEHLKRNN